MVSGGGPAVNTHANSSLNSPPLCEQCSESGHCALGHQMSTNKYVPWRTLSAKPTVIHHKHQNPTARNTARYSTHQNGPDITIGNPQKKIYGTKITQGTNQIITDMENLYLRVKPSPLYPHNNVKIRQENCPFHLVPSIGCGSFLQFFYL